MSRLPLLSHAMKSGVVWRALCRGLCQALGSSLLAGILLAFRGAAPLWEEHELQPGESRTHEVALEAGQFAQAIVDQGNADVEVRLLDPDGLPVQTADSLDRTIWDEEVAAVAEKPGSYRIEVRNAAGRYRLWIATPRRATEADRLRVEALRLGYEAAGIASRQQGEEAYRRQLALREQALALWQRLGDRPREAETLYHIGLLHQELGDRARCSRLLRQALAGLSDDAQRAQVLNEAGLVEWSLGAFQGARERFDEALPLAARSGDRRLESDILNNLGKYHITVLGEPQAAIDRYLDKALQTARELKYLKGQATALLNLGSAYHDRSEDQTALEHYKEGLDIARRLEDRELAATAFNNIADAYHSLGDLERARDDFQEALRLSRGPEEKATTLQNLGVVLEKSGRIDDAVRAYDTAFELAREIGNQDLQAYILTNRGYLHLGKGEYRQALEACRLAHPLASGRETKARTLHIMGASQRYLDDLPGARESLQQALALSQEDLSLNADITLVLAKVEHDEGNLELAGELAAAAIKTIEELRDRVIRQDLKESFLASKHGFYEFYIDILMEQDRRHPGQGFSARALEVNERARARGLLDLLAEVEADLSRDADAGLVAQEQHLRAEIGALYKRRLELAQAGVTDERMTQARRRLDESIEKLHQVNAELRISSPRYAALTRPELLSLAEIRKQVLDPGTVLLEYALGEKRSWLWVVTPESLESFPLPSRAEVEALAVRFYEQISRKPDPDPARAAQAERRMRETGAELARILLAGAEPHLRGRLLLVVSDGALSYVPFRALPLPSSLGSRPVLLVEQNDAVDLPSASTLAVLRDEESKRRPAAKILAAIGDPVFQEKDARLRSPASRGGRTRDGLGPSKPRGAGDTGDTGDGGDSAFDPSRLPRLLYSKVEVEHIVEMAGAAQSLKALGLEASRSLVTSGRLADYRIVHLATHGSIDADNPELSALAFSRFDRQGEPEPQEGLLSLADVYRLRLNADLVTLSACKTALGKEMRGEGLIGLTRGFMYAGSSRVLASLWQIEDRATAELMLRFYEGHLKERRPVPAALRQAQLEALRSPSRSHPYYWAAFSLQGESR